MSVVVKDAKIKKAETILGINKAIFIIDIISAIAGFVALAVLAIVKEDGMYFLYAVLCLVSILASWLVKQYLDGYALLVHQAAHMLFMEQVTTGLDEDEKKSETKQEKSYLDESIEERLKKDFGNK